MRGRRGCGVELFGRNWGGGGAVGGSVCTGVHILLNLLYWTEPEQAPH